ncbi:AIDA repeat-containing protein, partial [Escherichia coli]|nr:AIDA repeat-containing protein [Escherichia coli]
MNSGGQQRVSSGGSATSTTINSGGFQNVSSGGSA